MNKPLLIVSALKDEIKDLRAALVVQQAYHRDGAHFYQGELSGREVLVGYTGIGTAATRAALALLADLVPIGGVVGVGYAGALVDGIETGDLILAAELVSEQSPSVSGWQTNQDMRLRMRRQLEQQKNGWHEGRLLTVEQARTDVEQKREAAKQYAAIACDMESAALAAVCQERGLPFVVLRAVLDPVTAKVPDPAELMDRANRVSKRKVLSHVMKNPQAV